MTHELIPTLENPLENPASESKPVTAYDQAIADAQTLMERPYVAASIQNIERQHQKNRMTVWERLRVLSKHKPTVLYQNWGPNLDGASIVTAVMKIHDRDVAVYGHDFTLRAGAMDATNGRKLAELFRLAGERKIPVIGMNDSAGAYVPAGVGGLDGYAEAFSALRKISGVVPSIMCMFGFNAGGGSYLPRQGSFVIQPKNTFFGLTGPGVVKSVLGEDVTADELGGPAVHSKSGVADYSVEDEVAALRTATHLLNYIPDHHGVLAPYQPTSDSLDRKTVDIDILLKKVFNSPTGFNTPFEVGLIVQNICDHGDYFEFQPNRARNTLCAFGRLGGHVVGFCANNSAVASGQIDIDAAYKNARFIRFCNLYNIPMIFMEDTTGFLPGKEQESLGIVQAGRAMLDAIIDLRTPRFLLIIRNAFGGAYASFNNYNTGADFVLALPSARIAVMGPAGKTFVYKDELKAIQLEAKKKAQVGETAVQIDAWIQAQEQLLNKRYEKEFMNPKEALSLGSLSQLVMPTDLRKVLGEQLNFYMRHYQAEPFIGIQREFH